MSTSGCEISNSLRCATGNLNHLGVVKSPCKSPLTYIIAHRSWELFKDFYFALMEKHEPGLARRRKYAQKLKLKTFIVDASTIPTCLSLFDWAKFVTDKGGVKLHTVFDYDTLLSVFVHMT